MNAGKSDSPPIDHDSGSGSITAGCKTRVGLDHHTSLLLFPYVKQWSWVYTIYCHTPLIMSKASFGLNAAVEAIMDTAAAKSGRVFPRSIRELHTPPDKAYGIPKIPSFAVLLSVPVRVSYEYRLVNSSCRRCCYILDHVIFLVYIRVNLILSYRLLLL